MNVKKVCVFVLGTTMFGIAQANAERIGGVENDFDLAYVENKKADSNEAIIGFGLGAHKIDKGAAGGGYISGVVPVDNTDLGIYGRGELINDRYKTGRFWSWKMAIGLAFYPSDKVIPHLEVGKCFSNYSTCYFNNREAGSASDDIDAIYYGAGVYIKEPLFNNYIEVSADWSPYKNYSGRSLYVGYGFGF
ncbi:hypothetical protein [Vibrio sp. ER1A]|uniref:hypothetical protein n=3 Tax=Vibrio TaxID=662 RepID=UPI001267ACBD|nr:hypothetical protein [Vibrio sp. ER1A]